MLIYVVSVLLHYFRSQANRSLFLFNRTTSIINIYNNRTMLHMPVQNCYSNKEVLNRIPCLHHIEAIRPLILSSLPKTTRIKTHLNVCSLYKKVKLLFLVISLRQLTILNCYKHYLVYIQYTFSIYLALRRHFSEL